MFIGDVVFYLSNYSFKFELFSYMKDEENSNCILSIYVKLLFIDQASINQSKSRSWQNNKSCIDFKNHLLMKQHLRIQSTHFQEPEIEHSTIWRACFTTKTFSRDFKQQNSSFKYFIFFCFRDFIITDTESNGSIRGKKVSQKFHRFSFHDCSFIHWDKDSSF